MAPSGKADAKPCLEYKKSGKCSRGKQCDFWHTDYCFAYQKGNCKYGDKCNYRHAIKPTSPAYAAQQKDAPPSDPTSSPPPHPASHKHVEQQQQQQQAGYFVGIGSCQPLSSAEPMDASVSAPEQAPVPVQRHSYPAVRQYFADNHVRKTRFFIPYSKNPADYVLKPIKNYP